jgi:hypothetical protein
MACDVHATDRDELSHLQASYEHRLRSLAARVRGSSEAIVGDKLLMAMSRDPASAVHATERLGELLEKALASEQEDQIGRLCRELASCEAALGEAQRDAVGARREAADARAAVSRQSSDMAERRELEASATAARDETERLAEAIRAEQSARAEAEAQLSHATRSLGSVEAHMMRLEMELGDARQKARASAEGAEQRVSAMQAKACEAAEAAEQRVTLMQTAAEQRVSAMQAAVEQRVTVMQAAAAAQRDRHLSEVASSAALLRETADAAARAHGERVLQIAALQGMVLAARQEVAAAEEAVRAAEERARAAELGRAEASAAVASWMRRAEAAEAAAVEAAVARAAEAEARATGEASSRTPEELSTQGRGSSCQGAARESVRAAEQVAAAAQAALVQVTEERDRAVAERDAIAERYQKMGRRVEKLMEAERARSSDGREGALRAGSLETASSVAEYRWGGMERELAATRAEAEAKGSELTSLRAEFSRALSDLDAWREVRGLGPPPVCMGLSCPPPLPFSMQVSHSLTPRSPRRRRRAGMCCAERRAKMTPPPTCIMNGGRLPFPLYVQVPPATPRFPFHRRQRRAGMRCTRPSAEQKRAYQS